MRYATTEIVRFYDRDALEAEGFSRRELRHLREEGLLPPAVGTGRGAHYTDVHLSCLRRIRAARDENRTFADIRDMLAIDDGRDAPEGADEARYTVYDLAAAAGLSPRTVNRYVRLGLLPPVVGAGNRPRYTEEHLATVRRIAAAKRGNRSLSDLAAELQARYPAAFGKVA